MWEGNCERVHQSNKKVEKVCHLWSLQKRKPHYDWNGAKIKGTEDNEHCPWIREAIRKCASRTVVVHLDSGPFLLLHIWAAVLKKSDGRWCCRPASTGGMVPPKCLQQLTKHVTAISRDLSKEDCREQSKLSGTKCWKEPYKEAWVTSSRSFPMQVNQQENGN